MITAFKPSKPDRPRTHCLKQNKRTKKEDSFALMMKTPKETSVLIAFEKPTAIWDIKNGGHSTIGCTRPQNNMFEKSRTSVLHTSQQSNTTHCMIFTTWMAHNWCLLSQTMISIPSLMWRTHGTINISLQKCTYKNTGPYIKVNTYTRNKHNSHSQTTLSDPVLLLLKWTYIMLVSNTRWAVKPSKFDHDKININ